MLHVVLGETAQDGFSIRSPQAQSSRELDELVVLLFDDLPIDWAGQDRLQIGVFFRRTTLRPIGYFCPSPRKGKNSGCQIGRSAYS
jgi:hypothetical protein